MSSWELDKSSVIGKTPSDEVCYTYNIGVPITQARASIIYYYLYYKKTINHDIFNLLENRRGCISSAQ